MFFYKVFLLLFSFDIILTPFTTLLFQGGYKIAGQIFKLLSLLMFLCTIFYALIKNKIFIKNESIFFMFVIPVAVTIGLLRNGIISETFSHLYSIIMPISALSFGYYFSKDYISTFNFKKSIERYMFIFLILNSIGVLLYQVAFKVGFVPYPAVTAIGLFYTAVYYFSNKKYFLVWVSVLMIIISGKRVVLVMTLTSILYLLLALKKVSFKRIFKIIIIIFSIAIILVIIYRNTTYLNRFALTFQNLDFSNESALDLATGGRSSEIINIIDYINMNQWIWLTGGGIGSKVEVFEGFYRHYSHFSPLGYIMVFGVIFTFGIYGNFIKKIIKFNRNSAIQTVFQSIFVGLVVSSLFGGILFTDIKFWFISGVNTVILNEYKLRLKKYNVKS